MIFNMSTGGASTADKIKYDNTESGLQSTNVQGAVDELNSSLSPYKITEIDIITGKATENEYNVECTFTKTHKAPPKVFAIANNRAINVSVNNISETGCTFVMKYIAGSAGNYELTYMCIE